MDCSRSGSSVHGILPGRKTGWLRFPSLGSTEATCVPPRGATRANSLFGIMQGHSRPRIVLPSRKMRWEGRTQNGALDKSVILHPCLARQRRPPGLPGNLALLGALGGHGVSCGAPRLPGLPRQRAALRARAALSRRQDAVSWPGRPSWPQVLCAPLCAQWTPQEP